MSLCIVYCLLLTLYSLVSDLNMIYIIPGSSLTNIAMPP